MALRYIDSFDHYDDTELPFKWTAVNAATISLGTYPAGAARTGPGGMSITTEARYVEMTLDSQATWIVGLAFAIGTLPQTNAMHFVGFRDTGTLHCDVRIDALGRLTFTRNGTVLATGTTILTTGVMNHLEVKVIISDTVGLGEVKLNGVLEIGYYGAGTQGAPTGDTRNAANSTANQIRIGGNGSSGQTVNYAVDDLYFCDGTGSAPANTFLGDCRVDSLHPNGNGNSSQFIGQDLNSTDNYLNVDEVNPPDDDTTYNQSAVVGEKDTYAYGNLTPTSGTVYGVQPVMWARKSDAGSRAVCSVARLSGTETDSSNRALADSYTYYADVRETKPGGGAWTISDVNSAEFGMKVTV